MTPVAHTKVAERDTTRSSLFAETAITGIVLVLSTIMAEYLLASYASLIAVAAFFVALVLKRGGFFVKYFAFVFAIGCKHTRLRYYRDAGNQLAGTRYL